MADPSIPPPQAKQAASKAPPVSKKPRKLTDRLKNLQKDEEKRKEAEQLSEGIDLYDSGSPAAQKMREHRRQTFHEFCEIKALGKKMDDKEACCPDKIVQRTCDMLFEVAAASEGT